MMDSPDAESKLPVGSSASKSGGSFISALAIATRCCSPPESSLMKCSARSASPTRCNNDKALSAIEPVTGIKCRGPLCFQPRSVRGSRLND